MNAPELTPPQSTSPPMYTPPPAPQPPVPVAADGIQVPEPVKTGGSGGIREFFSDINLLDIGFSALLVGTLYYFTYYYKFQVQFSKNNFADLNGRVSKLESFAEAQKKKEQQANATGARKKGMLGLR